MAVADLLTTTLSTKGQVILPTAIRRRRKWDAGTKLIVEETADGVLLRAAPLFPATTVDEVFGSANYKGPTVTLEQMDKAIAEEVARRHARGRY